MNYASFLQTFVDWVKGALPNEDRFVNLTLVSNDREGPVRYAEGRLRLSETSTFSALVGDVITLYESNERWGEEFEEERGNGFPFNPKITDKVRVTLNLTLRTISITSRTKGEAIIENPESSNDLIFGFVTTGKGDLGVGGFSGVGIVPFRPYYVISLTKAQETRIF